MHSLKLSSLENLFDSKFGKKGTKSIDSCVFYNITQNTILFFLKT